MDTPKFDAFLHHLGTLLPLQGSNRRALLVGSAPLAARQLRDTRDLDVLVSRETLTWVIKKHHPPFHMADQVHFDFGEGIQISSSLNAHIGGLPLDFGTLFEQGDPLPTRYARPYWRTLDLPMWRRIKRHMGREKDADDLYLLHQYERTRTVHL